MPSENSLANKTSAQLRLLTAKDAADLLRLSQSWLAKCRMRGDGPPFVKMRRSVRYDEAALIAWMQTNLRRSTHE